MKTNLTPQQLKNRFNSLVKKKQEVSRLENKKKKLIKEIEEIEMILSRQFPQSSSNIGVKQ